MKGETMSHFVPVCLLSPLFPLSFLCLFFSSFCYSRSALSSSSYSPCEVVPVVVESQ